MKRQSRIVLSVSLVAAMALTGCNPAARDTSKDKKLDGGKAAATEEIAPPAVPRGEGKSSATERTVPAAAKPAPTARIEPTVEPAAEPAAPAAASETLKRPLPKYLADVPLIPRKTLFGNPDKASPRLSPDGQRLAYLAPVKGVLNVFVGPVDDVAAAKPVTHDRKRGVRAYFWAYDNQHVLYVQDTDGDENWHIYAVNLAGEQTRDLTPIKDVNAEVEGISDRVPGELLVGLNDRDAEVHDVYRVNIVSGERKLIEKNEQGFSGYLTDEDLQVRFAMQSQPDGSELILQPDGAGGWKDFMTIPKIDTVTTSPAGFDKSGQVLYFIDSRDRDTGALTAIDLKTGQQKTLAEHSHSDVAGVMSHPTEHTIEAVAFNHRRKDWKVLDPAVQGDLDFLRTVSRGDVEVASRTLDDKQWIVAFMPDNGPVRYYLYDRAARQTKFLFANRPELDGLPLVEMQDVVIKARDGLELVSYLSLPKGTDPDGDGQPSEPLPLVLIVHGGPWARDDWGFDAEHQLWANRGYAVLSVNFRGSTGLGKSFVNAGDREWAGKMHTDLLDAVDWAVKQGIADPKRVAITGGSYGGYATLVGMTMTPEVFACGIDIVGPSNIVTLLATIPPYWKPEIQLFKDRVGDFTTEEGRQFLHERSPLTFVDKISRPLLIAQGANDPRVKQSEADQIVKAMESKRIPVTYVLYSDEGHGFARPENRLSFYAVSEAFLAEHLGGRYEAIGTAFENSTIAVPAGAGDVPGLEAALNE